jgi:RNA polymerase sigma-70 factor (ECF subfamily)
MTSPATPTDFELLRLMIDGDQSAFTTLYRRRQAGVFRFALQMTGSRATAEDVTQEVFVVLMREAGRFDPERGSLSAFLYGVARNNLLRKFEQERRFVALDEDNENGALLAAVPSSSPDPHQELNSKEVTERVRRAVLSLPERYREAVVLCDLHEMSYEDAAGVIGCALGTVRSRLHRGRALLIEKLDAINPHPQAEPARPARCLA